MTPPTADPSDPFDRTALREALQFSGDPSRPALRRRRGIAEAAPADHDAAVEDDAPVPPTPPPESDLHEAIAGLTTAVSRLAAQAVRQGDHIDSLRRHLDDAVTALTQPDPAEGVGVASPEFDKLLELSEQHTERLARISDAVAHLDTRVEGRLFSLATQMDRITAPLRELGLLQQGPDGKPVSKLFEYVDDLANRFDALTVRIESTLQEDRSIIRKLGDMPQAVEAQLAEIATIARGGEPQSDRPPEDGRFEAGSSPL